MKIKNALIIIAGLTFTALSPQARATCQEGCLINFNTVLGEDTLNVNTGSANTAIGYTALLANTDGANNTAIGTNALEHNTTGFENTATGVNALFQNSTGIQNTLSALLLSSATPVRSITQLLVSMRFNKTQRAIVTLQPGPER